MQPQAGPSFLPASRDQTSKHRPAEQLVGKTEPSCPRFLKDNFRVYLEGGQADGPSQPNPQAHSLVAQPLALVPVLQQT